MRLSIRSGENLHILFWLLKDLCWVMDARVAGLLLVIPAVLVAVWICWRSRAERSEFVHALAVVLWILANSTWMIGEFFLAGGTRPYAIFLFVAGLSVLAFHHLPSFLRAPRHRSN
jgi:hypothetical protein